MIWKLIAKLALRFEDNLYARCFCLPYYPIPGYMDRFWVFNPYLHNYEPTEAVKRMWRFSWLPNVRIHHILRADNADHLHDHPWNARTIILRGWYRELREDGSRVTRRRGDTARILFGQFHHVEEVSEGGVWTLFFTWPYLGTWGFKVNGEKVPYQKYLAEHPERS